MRDSLCVHGFYAEQASITMDVDERRINQPELGSRINQPELGSR